MPKNLTVARPSDDNDRLAVSLLTEFRAAHAAGDHGRMTDVMLAAIDLDRSAPDQPRLMDEIRGIRDAANAYEIAA